MFNSLDHCMVFLFVLITLSRFWTVFEALEKVVNQDGRHSEMITQLSCYVTSSPHDADVKEGILKHVKAWFETNLHKFRH